MGGDPDVDADALARAEAALAALSDDYLRRVRADVAAAVAAIAEMRTAPQERRPAVAEWLFTVAHEIKGQGTTFDYPLMTALGKAMCDLLRRGTVAEGEPLDRLAALAAAMAEVVGERLCGDGGERGRALMNRLAVQVTTLSVEC